MDLVYNGFTHESGIRFFRFECQVYQPRPLANRTVQFVVRADMSLFARYGIAIQEGPAICRGILAEAITGVEDSDLVSTSYSVEEMHMASFAAARSALVQAKSVRRHKPPIVSSD